MKQDCGRRVRVYTLGQNEVLDLFASALGGWPRHIVLPKIEGLPADADVVDVRHDWEGRCFRFLVEHPSFDPVPPGEPPRRFGPLEHQRVELRPAHDAAAATLDEMLAAVKARNWASVPEGVKLDAHNIAGAGEDHDDRTIEEAFAALRKGRAS